MARRENIASFSVLPNPNMTLHCLQLYDLRNIVHLTIWNPIRSIEYASKIVQRSFLVSFVEFVTIWWMFEVQTKWYRIVDTLKVLENSTVVSSFLHPKANRKRHFDRKFAVFLLANFMCLHKMELFQSTIFVKRLKGIERSHFRWWWALENVKLYVVWMLSIASHYTLYIWFNFNGTNELPSIIVAFITPNQNYIDFFCSAVCKENVSYI